MDALIAEGARRPVKQITASSDWFHGGDSRFDATAYASEAYLARRAVMDAGFEIRSLASIVGRVYHPTENQARSNFKRIWVDQGEGPPFLTGRQLFFFRPDRQRFISGKMRKLDELLVPQGALLVSRSGTTGLPVYVGRWLSHFAVTDDAIRIFGGEEPIGYIYAYLASRYGHSLMLSGEYGSTVSHLEAKHIEEVPVPIIPQRDAIHNRIMEAASLRDQANELLDQCDAELYHTLGVRSFSNRDVEYLGNPAQPHAFRVLSSEIGDRLDASHHIPVARSAVEKLRKGRFPLVRLGDRVEHVYVAPRFARIYVEAEFGTPLLQGSQLPMIRPYGLRFVSTSRTEGLERWIVRAGTVLVTCSGTIGRVSVVTQLQDRWAASQHILRIVPRDRVTHAGFLAAYLVTPYGQHQLRAKIYGGVVDELTQGDTADVLIPDVPFDVQVSIGQAVLDAYELKDKAAALEDNAIDAVEAAISREVVKPHRMAVACPACGSTNISFVRIEPESERVRHQRALEGETVGRFACRACGFDWMRPPTSP